MNTYPLLVRSILEGARAVHGEREIVSCGEGEAFRYTIGAFHERTRRLAGALASLGIRRGDRVSTFAWNTHRHLELYYGIPCFGAVLHTVNFRLFDEQLIYVFSHAGDRVIFVDPDLAPILERLQGRLAGVELFVVLDDSARTRLRNAVGYESLLEKATPVDEFPTDLDEDSPAGLCYTSATTGMPKGVVYTHRMLFTHTLAGMGLLSFDQRDTVCPIVPMFHANAWGAPYSTLWAGSRLILPGPHPTPERICEILANEKVTMSMGVPTVWMNCLPLLKTGKYDVRNLKRILIGGAAVPEGLMKAYDTLGIRIVHAYGLTETAPLVTVCNMKSGVEEDPGVALRVRLKQGLLAAGLEMKILGDEGTPVPRDGETPGELWLRGPWIATGYYKDPERTAEHFKDGWFRTGDVVTIDAAGYIQIVDRKKDLVKSGGEWISSVELENQIMSHPAVAEAAVIGIPDMQWQERPLACIVLKPGATASAQDIQNFLKDKVSKWWIPDQFEFLKELPKTSVGKFAKTALRKQFLPKYAPRPEASKD